MEKRLDRSICNDAWLNFWDCSACCTLIRSRSDHYPLLLNLAGGVQGHPSSFKFMHMWSEHQDCHRLVQEIWNRPVSSCAMVVLAQKLRNLKAELKTWNKEVFGDVHKNVKQAQQEVENIQNLIQSQGQNDDLIKREKDAQLVWQKALMLEEDFWREKSRLNC